MNNFLAGTDVSLTVPLIDETGNKLSVDSIQFRVTDQDGKVILPLTALASFVHGAASATVTVPAENNALTDKAKSAIELRAVELHCVIAGNTSIINAGYSVSLADRLVVGINSFQTYSQAEFNAMSGIASIPAWNEATKEKRTVALIEARTRICKLSFTQLNGNVTWGQDSLNLIPEGSFATNYVRDGGMWLFSGNISLLTPDQFARLPQKFLLALCRAQIVEADEILSDNTPELRRRQGLLLETIGEVKQMYRSGKPLEMPVCRRAMSYLSYFVSNSKRIAR